MYQKQAIATLVIQKEIKKDGAPFEKNIKQVFSRQPSKTALTIFKCLSLRMDSQGDLPDWCNNSRLQVI